MRDSAVAPTGKSAFRRSSRTSMALALRSDALGDVPERIERLLEAGHHLAVGRASKALGSGLSQVARRPCSHSSPRPRMVGEPLDVLGERDPA